MLEINLKHQLKKRKMKRQENKLVKLKMKTEFPQEKIKRRKRLPKEKDEEKIKRDKEKHREYARIWAQKKKRYWNCTTCQVFVISSNKKQHLRSLKHQHHLVAP